MKRLFFLVIMALLIFTLVSFLLYGTDVEYFNDYITFRYFIETLSYLDIDFSSIGDTINSLQYYFDTINNFTSQWWNPLYYIEYFINSVRFVIDLIGSLVEDLFNFISSIWFVFQRLLFVV